MGEHTGQFFIEKNDKELVDLMATIPDPISTQTPAMGEMMRRQIIAIRDFNKESGDQAAAMIYLTKWIIGLTIALGVVAILQLAATFWPMVWVDATKGGRAMSRVTELSQKVEESWKRIMNRIIDAEADGHNIPSDMLERIFDTVQNTLHAAKVGQSLTLEEQTRILVRAFGDEFERIDREYPYRRDGHDER
jgi:hypothetical protein